MIEDKEEIKRRLVNLYIFNPLAAALACDKVLDRSGGLLGDIRNEVVAIRNAALLDEIAEAALTAQSMDAEVGTGTPQYHGDKDSGFLDYPTAEVGGPKKIYRYLDRIREHENYTIERCAQVADKYEYVYGSVIATAIRKLKDES